MGIHGEIAPYGYNLNAQAKWTSIFLIWNPKLSICNRPLRKQIEVGIYENPHYVQGHRVHRNDLKVCPYGSPTTGWHHCVRRWGSTDDSDGSTSPSRDCFWIRILSAFRGGFSFFCFLAFVLLPFSPFFPVFPFPSPLGSFMYFYQSQLLPQANETWLEETC